MRQFHRTIESIYSPPFLQPPHYHRLNRTNQSNRPHQPTRPHRPYHLCSASFENPSLLSSVEAAENSGFQSDRSIKTIHIFAQPLLLLLLIVLTASNVYADNIVYSDQIGSRVTNWEGSFQIPQFDPALGELSHVDITLTTEIVGESAYENLGPTAGFMTLTHSAEVKVTLQGDSISVGLPIENHIVELDAFDGLLDNGGTSGNYLKIFKMDRVTKTIDTAQDLNPFLGTGIVSIPIAATGSSDSRGPGNFSIQLNAIAAGAILTVDYFFRVPNIEIETYTNGFDADDPNGLDVPSIDMGEVVTWTYEVKNSGDIAFTQDEVEVTDSVAGVTPIWVPSSDDGDGLLSPDEVWVYEFTTTAIDLFSASAEVPIVQGCDPGQTAFALPTYGNVGRVAVSRYGLTDEDPTHHCNQLDVDLDLRKLIDGIHVQSNYADNVPAYQPGEPIQWTYQVENVSLNAYPQNIIAVTDSDPAVNPVFDLVSDVGGDGILSPGETWIYTATSMAQNLDRPEPGTSIVRGCGPDEADAERSVYQNIASLYVDGEVLVDASFYCQARNTILEIEKLTNGHDADDPNGSDVPLIEPGQPITWTYLVKNSGTQAVVLSDVNVQDNQLGIWPQFDSTSDHGNDGILSPNEQWTFLAASVAQYLHIPSPVIAVVDGCQITGTSLIRQAYENIGTVSLSNRLADSDYSHYCNPPNPNISVEKLTNGVDGDTANEVGVPQITPGSMIQWVYFVHNRGNIPFTHDEVQVVDSHLELTPILVRASDLNGDRILSPGEIWRYMAMQSAVDLTVPNAEIQTVDGCDPANLGTNRLTYVNSVTVKAPGVEATDASHYCNPPNPGIDIEKMTLQRDADNPNSPFVPILAEGLPITWTYIVHNTGNVTFTDDEIHVTDSDPAVTPIWLPDSDDRSDRLLTPGERWYYIASGTAQNLYDPLAGTSVVNGCDPSFTGIPSRAYQNLAVVQAGNIYDSDPSHYCVPTERHLTLQKFTNGVHIDNAHDPLIPRLRPGERIEWLYVVTNVGTDAIHLHEISLTDSDPAVTPLFDPSTDVDADGILEPGEVWHYRALGRALDLTRNDSLVATLKGCSQNGQLVPRLTYQNAAVVRAGESAASDVSYYCNLQEGIAFKKLTNGADAADPNGRDVPEVQANEAITWTYVLTNSGEVAYPLSEITVIDGDPSLLPLLESTSDVGGDEILSPGETWIFYATGQARSLAREVVNVSLVPGCSSTPDASSRLTYENQGAALVGSQTDTDKSHYCNPIVLDFDIQKFTNGHDADDPNGADVPLMIPGTPDVRSDESMVRWTYVITNSGNVNIQEAEIQMAESDPTLTPVLDRTTDSKSDGILSVGESWTYRAEAIAQDLRFRTNESVSVPGCLGATGIMGLAYHNLVTVSIGGVSQSDPSHYCSFTPTSADVVEEPEQSEAVRLFIPTWFFRD
ncbi:MAG: choice-of-anchor E domain-containing protein [Chloroflexota bacterium]